MFLEGPSARRALLLDGAVTARGTDKLLPPGVVVVVVVTAVVVVAVLVTVLVTAMTMVMVLAVLQLPLSSH